MTVTVIIGDPAPGSGHHPLLRRPTGTPFLRVASIVGNAGSDAMPVVHLWRQLKCFGTSAVAGPVVRDHPWSGSC